MLAARATSSHDHHSLATCPEDAKFECIRALVERRIDIPTPLKPNRTKIPRFMKPRRESGCQAVLGTNRIPYAKDKSETRLKEIADAIGAPIKPRRIGSGPHTEGWREVE
jgi:tRNA(Ser,Leu) C12 N-acetylase TAN1